MSNVMRGVERPSFDSPAFTRRQAHRLPSFTFSSAVKRAGLRTMLPSGPRRPSLHSVLRGGISFVIGPATAAATTYRADASPRPCAPEIRVSILADAARRCAQRSAFGETVDSLGVVLLL